MQELDVENLNFLEQTVSRNLGFENTDSESSKRTEGHAIGNWRKGDPCYIASESLATMSSVAMWNAELVPYDL